MNKSIYPHWGPILAWMSECRREVIPGEIGFWANQIKGKQSVLEIGAGTGYLSTHFAATVRDLGGNLVFVEPEMENIAILREKLRQQNLLSFATIEHCYFENYESSELFDYILFPYDSLPMVPKSKRKSLIGNVAKHLKQGGVFGLHFSSISWNQNFITEIGTKPYHFSFPHPEWPEKYINATLSISNVTSASYEKRFFLEFEDIVEIYTFSTEIIDREALIGDAISFGLSLSDWFSDFESSKVIGGDDLILIFKRN